MFVLHRFAIFIVNEYFILIAFLLMVLAKFIFLSSFQFFLTLSISPSFSKYIQLGINWFPKRISALLYPNINSRAVIWTSGSDSVWRIIKFSPNLVKYEPSETTSAILWKEKYHKMKNLYFSNISIQWQVYGDFCSRSSSREVSMIIIKVIFFCQQF